MLRSNKYSIFSTRFISSANRQRGLFYFDSSFRPVPLEQHFLGIKGKPGSTMARKNLDDVIFEKVSELVREGHQVMVFVHARKETVKSALALKEAATKDGSLDNFSCMDHPQFQVYRRDIGISRNREMKQLFDDGFGIHHAGMLRSDRNMIERMFEARAIKVRTYDGVFVCSNSIPSSALGAMLHSYACMGCQSSSACRQVLYSSGYSGHR
jgi:antiviral helicase SLH1